MRNLLDEPTPIAEPLSPHALSHVMSDLLSNFVLTDEEEIVCNLRDAKYRPNEIEQIMNAWARHWEATRQCHTCGQPATHLWGALGEDGQWGSMSGAFQLTPSCDACGGNRFDDGTGSAVIRAPLAFELDVPTPLQVATVDQKRMDSIRELLDEDAAGRAVNQQELREELSHDIVRRVSDALRHTQRVESDLASLRRRVAAAQEALS